LLAWGAVMGALVATAVPFWPERRPSGVTPAAWGWWLAAFSAYFVLFWLSLPRSARSAPSARTARPPAWRYPLLAGETATVLAIMSLRPALGLEGALFVPIAFQLGRERRPTISIVWITLQTAAMFAILRGRFGFDHAFSLLAAYFPFQLLAFFTSSLLRGEEHAREQAARVNAELLATREMLADSSCAAERLRISRELHDVFGHRLAALSLNLELARRVAEEERERHIGTACELTRSLLGEVREVAANLRLDASLDVGRALRRLVRDVPHPRVHLACPERLRTHDDALAQALVRCTQEAVTNAMKYANAENLWIRVSESGAGVELDVADDGEGASEPRAGNGLRGIRERVEELGGSVELECARRAGFRVRVFVPSRACRPCGSTSSKTRRWSAKG
jgi:signal transduction histidine kinase